MYFLRLMAIVQNTKQILWIPSAHTDPRNNFKQIIFKDLDWAGLQETDTIHFSPWKMLQHAGDLLNVGFPLPLSWWILTPIDQTAAATASRSCLLPCPSLLEWSAQSAQRNIPVLQPFPVHHPDFHAKPTLNWSFKLRHWVLQFILVCSSELLTCKLQETVLPSFYSSGKVSFPEKYINIFLGCKLLNWYLISTGVATKEGRESDIK